MTVKAEVCEFGDDVVGCKLRLLKIKMRKLLTAQLTVSLAGIVHDHDLIY